MRRYAESDAKSMNSWVEAVLDSEDMRRRCDAHEQWLQQHPEHTRTAAAWADGNLDELSRR